MMLPSRLTLVDYAYALDGGTTSLSGTDADGRGHRIMLVQHAFPQASPSLDALPGRLYFDGQLVPLRSELEAGVLGLLRSANVRPRPTILEEGQGLQLSPNALILGEDLRQVFTRGPEDNIRALTAKVIQFVESDQYLAFAERVEQAADTARYDVWVAWDAANRKQVLVRLARLLGVGLRAAGEMLEQERPLARGVTALEVSDLAERYRTDGLGVRVHPEFRWPLP